MKFQKGVALFSALLVFALLVLLLGQLLVQVETAIEKTSWAVNSAQLSEFSLAGEQQSIVLLIEKLQEGSNSGNQQTNQTDESIYDFLERTHTLEIDNAIIETRFYDAQGLINPNSIASNSAIRDVFTRFFNDEGLDNTLINKIIDWIDTDEEQYELGGEEGIDYQALDPPYAVANRPMSDASEMIIATEIDTEAYKLIAPLMLALPKPTRVNINTAPAKIFDFVNPALNGEQITNSRNQMAQRFASVDEFMKSNLTAGVELDASLFTTETEYFYLSTRISLGKLESNHSSLYQYNKLSHSMELLSRLELHSRASNLW